MDKETNKRLLEIIASQSLTNIGWEMVPTKKRTKDMTMEQNMASTNEASTGTTREEILELIIRVKREEQAMKALLKLKEFIRTTLMSNH